MTRPVSSIALLEKTLAAEVTAGPYRVLPLSRLKPNPQQPRRIFAEDINAALQEPEFLELVASIRTAGRVLQPLLVQPPDPEGFHVIVAGERRYHAAKAAGLSEVPVLVVETTDSFTLKLYSLIENLHRQDLSLWDRAQYLAGLLAESGLSKQELAEKIGISPSQLSKYLAVLDGPQDLREAVQDRIVSDTETVRLLKSTEPDLRASLLDRARASGQALSRRDAERAVEPQRKVPPSRSSVAPVPTGPRSEPSAAPAEEPSFTLPPLTRPQLAALLRHLGAEHLPEDRDALAQVFLELVNRLI